MVKRTIVCFCSQCGARFEKRTTKKNKKAASKWVSWATKTFVFCQDCRVKQFTETAEAFLGCDAENRLPELVGSKNRAVLVAAIRKSYAECVCYKRAAMKSIIGITRDPGEKEYMTLFFEKYDQLVNDIFYNETSIPWWIHHRDPEELNQTVEAEVLSTIKK